jgi:DNA-directed RNA polymerase subunit RPC12/RpoP
MKDETEQEQAADDGADSDEDTSCTRCDGRLFFLGKKDFHEGTRAWGFILGDVGELLTGSEEMAMFVCEDCGHVEFFMPMKK